MDERQHLRKAKAACSCRCAARSRRSSISDSKGVVALLNKLLRLVGLGAHRPGHRVGQAPRPLNGAILAR